MDYDTLSVLYKNAPTFAALRKDWLPLAVSFLYEVFKRQHHVSLPQDTFQESLDAMLERVNASLPREQRHQRDAAFYMDRWSREDDLIRIYSHDDNFIVQLSPHAERLIGWFEEMQAGGMIGTESRLRTIQTLLDEVVTLSTEDIEARLAQLRQRRDEIDAEIERIQSTGQMDGLSDVQIRERLEHVNSMASQLLRDFSAVEERFRDMARDIQQAQLDPHARRGDILSSALDADEQLEASDEGQSFRAFYEMLTHPDQREGFNNLLNALYDMERLRGFVQDNRLLRRLTSHLLEAGERVNQSNQRLAAHLRRVVDTRNVLESRRVQLLAQEIKHQAGQIAFDDWQEITSYRGRFHMMEAEPLVDLPLERPLYEPPQQVAPSARPRQAPMHLEQEALEVLYDTFYIDETRLHENVARLLMSRERVTLADVVQSYPITQGMAEVVAYLLLAARHPQHGIDHAQRDQLSIRASAEAEAHTIEVPRIVYRREGAGDATPSIQGEPEHV